MSRSGSLVSAMQTCQNILELQIVPVIQRLPLVCSLVCVSETTDSASMLAVAVGNIIICCPLVHLSCFKRPFQELFYRTRKNFTIRKTEQYNKQTVWLTLGKVYQGCLRSKVKDTATCSQSNSSHHLRKLNLQSLMNWWFLRNTVKCIKLDRMLTCFCENWTQCTVSFAAPLLQNSLFSGTDGTRTDRSFSAAITPLSSSVSCCVDSGSELDIFHIPPSSSSSHYTKLHFIFRWALQSTRKRHVGLIKRV